jgi:hypothetical protein
MEERRGKGKRASIAVDNGRETADDAHGLREHWNRRMAEEGTLNAYHKRTRSDLQVTRECRSQSTELGSTAICKHSVVDISAARSPWNITKFHNRHIFQFESDNQASDQCTEHWAWSTVRRHGATAAN